MASGNFNDQDWKNKLEDINALQGEILEDKNAAWEKLEARLAERPHRVKTIWYWAAASWLLLVTLVRVDIPVKDTHTLVKNVVKNTQPMMEISTPPAPLKKSYISPSINGYNNQTLQVVKTKQRSPAKNIIKKEEIIALNFNPQNITPVSAPLDPVINRAVETTIATPLKKKLNVIHINELGDYDEDKTIITRYNEPRSFQLKLINQQVYSNPVLPSNYTGLGIFKSKNIPSN